MKFKRYTHLSIDVAVAGVAQTRVFSQVSFYIQDLFASFVGLHLSEVHRCIQGTEFPEAIATDIRAQTTRMYRKGGGLLWNDETLTILWRSVLGVFICCDKTPNNRLLFGSESGN